MLINAGVTHPQPIWLDRLREGGRLVMPLTIAISPTIGQGIMLKFVRLVGRRLYAIRSWKRPCEVGAEAAVATRANEPEESCIPRPGPLPKRHPKYPNPKHMSTLQNRRFKLTSRPVGMVKRSDFDFVTAPAAEPGAGKR